MKQPDCVLCVLDNDNFLDRYTVVTKIRGSAGRVEALSLSPDCDGLNGVSQFTECAGDYISELMEQGFSSEKDDKTILIEWDKLPENVQLHAIDRLEEDDGEK